jgi:hypothetical protein
VVASPEPAPAVIHACANKASGILKIVAAGQECGPSENALAWNVAGPPGPPGPPGASGLANVQAYSEQGTGSSVRVFCPAGTIVVGGGAVSHTPSLALIQSFPITATGENANGPFLAGWQAAPVDWAGPVQAFVLCASP